MKVSAIITAAGQGKRMGKAKQFIDLSGLPVVGYSLKIFNECELINEIILVVNAEDQNQARKLITILKLSKPVKVTTGGKERQDSVYNGLKLVAEDAEIVIIHDGCRPLVAKSLIVDLISEAKTSGAAVPGVPVKDTVKEINAEKLVVSTLDRSILVNIQTPQAFKKELIQEAYEHAQRIKYLATDDARLVERLGQPVKVIPGAYDNLKITTPEDLLIAEAFMRGKEN